MNQFIKADKNWINLNNVTDFADVEMYDAAGDQKIITLVISYNSGPDGDTWLRGDARIEFLEKVTALAAGITQYSEERRIANSLAQIAVAIGDPADDSLDGDGGEAGNLLQNMDWLGIRLADLADSLDEVVDKLGWLKGIAQTD